MNDVRVVYVKIVEVLENGEEGYDPMFTYFVYDNRDSSYGPQRYTIEEVAYEVNIENVIEVLQIKYPAFYIRALADGELRFLNTKIPMKI